MKQMYIFNPFLQRLIDQNYYLIDESIFLPDERRGKHLCETPFG